jgi:cytochrome c oxidase subunit 3
MSSSFFTQRHALHLVDLSIMPLITSSAVLTMTIGGVMYFHGYSFGVSTLFFGLICVLLCMFL